MRVWVNQVAFHKQEPTAPAAACNGGRGRKSLVNRDEEDVFLKPWFESAAIGIMVMAFQIRDKLHNSLAPREAMKTMLITRAVRSRRVRLMFQDEACLGRMVLIRCRIALISCTSQGS